MDEAADPEMIVRSAEAGAFLRANRAFVDAVGFCPSELAKKPFVEWIDEADRDAFRRVLESHEDSCRVRHQARSGEALALDVRVRDRGDGPFVLARRASPDAGALDETERDAETTVKGTLHKIAKIVEEQNPGYRCSILLVAHGRFVSGAGPSLPDEYNKAIDGYAIGPAVGSCGTAIYWNVPVIVEDIQNDPLWQPFAELAKTAGVAACWSHPFASKGGRVLGALALYSPEPRTPTPEQLSRLRAAAQMTGLAVERGRAEEALRSANAVKARFMANMSHEVRTPLNALIGLADSMHADALRGAPGAANWQNEITWLRDAGEQLLDLFTGVLELTSEQDRMGREKPVDLRACIQSIGRSFEGLACERGTKIQCTLRDSLPQSAWIDEWALERCMKLLVDNAVKFTQDGRIEIDCDIDAGKLCVEIADTGCGIDLDRLDELRQPFVQGDLSTTKEYRGSGLGLALADLCMDALGGKLHFATNDNGGTTIRFAVPLEVAAPTTEAPPPRPSVEATSTTSLPILIVEDNPLNSKVLERILERSGYTCLRTENGEEALRAMRDREFCCILMDCQMPVMDGYEATRQIRALEEGSGKHIPIIAVTANAMPDDRDICLRAGMDDYLPKPVRQKMLLGALEGYIGVPPTTT